MSAAKIWAGKADGRNAEVWAEDDDVIVYERLKDGSLEPTDDRMAYLALCAMTVENMKSGAIPIVGLEKVPTRFKLTITAHVDVPDDAESRLRLNYRIKSRAMKLLADMKREISVGRRVDVKVETDK